MKNEIRLTLKKLWFKLIRDYRKIEEYRDITPYYCARLCANYKKDSIECKDCKTNYCRPEPKANTVHFTLGYPRNDDNERHLVREIEEIRKGRGRLIWGAPQHRCFVIHLKPTDNGRN